MDNLDKAAKLWHETHGIYLAESINKEIIDSFKAGAKWSKEQCEKLINLAKKSWYEEGFLFGQIEGLPEDSKYNQGMFDMKEKLLKDTIEREVKIDGGGYPYIDCKIELYDYDKDAPLAKKGDKVKIIIIRDN